MSYSKILNSLALTVPTYTNMPTVTITLEHYIELALRHHPYVIIQQDDEIWTAIMSVSPSERLSYILENEEWTIGFNCEPIKSVSGIRNGWRLWHRKDWELCDNKRQEAVRRIDAAQLAYRERRAIMLEAVHQEYLAKGITEAVWPMIAANISDVILKDMYEAMGKKG